jgi:hypothetical protein
VRVEELEAEALLCDCICYSPKKPFSLIQTSDIETYSQRDREKEKTRWNGDRGGTGKNNSVRLWYGTSLVCETCVMHEKIARHYAAAALAVAEAFLGVESGVKNKLN